MYNDKVHMHDQVTNKVDEIMNFYKKKTNKKFFLLYFCVLNVMLLAIIQIYTHFSILLTMLLN